MAFESFLNQDQSRPKKWQRLTLMISLGLHGVALVVGLVYSFWHVDELSPPTVTVTFMSAPPPPPPPPPPPKKKSSSTTKPKTPVEIVQPRPNQLVQPKQKEEPKEEEEEEGAEEGGVEGGVKGGVVGGVVGGVLGSTGPVDAPKTLPPNVGVAQVVTLVKPVAPLALQKTGQIIFNMVRICVDATGNLQDVKLVKPSDPLWDNAVTSTIKGSWKFKPALVAGKPVPFCFMYRFNLTPGT